MNGIFSQTPSMNIYTLDPRCIPAMEKVREYYLSIPEWQKDVREGKMFGVLIYSPTNVGEGSVSYLAAFSGTLGGKTCQPGFVPPVFDIQEGEGRQLGPPSLRRISLITAYMLPCAEHIL